VYDAGVVDGGLHEDEIRWFGQRRRELESDDASISAEDLVFRDGGPWQ
jgi:hypothetical protein